MLRGMLLTKSKYIFLAQTILFRLFVWNGNLQSRQKNKIKVKVSKPKLISPKNEIILYILTGLSAIFTTDITRKPFYAVF